MTVQRPIATRLFTIMLPGQQALEVWKQPSEAFDVTFDWSRLLAGDTIASSVWVLPTGWTEPEASSIDATGTKAVVWLGGGEADTMSVLINTITTTAGRTFRAHCLTHCYEEASA